MKLRSKKILAVLLAGSIGTGAFAVGAANLTKNVQLRYNNIAVKVDGQVKQPNMEPFFIGDSVYVSLRDAGQLVGNQVNWNGTTQTVEINTNTISNSIIEQDLANKNHQLAVANSKIKDMEAKIAKYEKQLGITDDKEDSKDDDKDTSTSKELDLKATLKNLEKYYSDKYDVEWTFRLKGDESKLTFEIRYDSKKDGKYFKEISKSTLEKFTKDMVKDIQTECGSIKVVGEVYDTYDEVTVATFEMSTKGSFDFEYKRNSNYKQSDLDDFAKILKNKFGTFPRLDLGSMFDGSSIRVRDVKLEANNDVIEFSIYTDYADMTVADSAWYEMNSTQKDKLETYLNDMQDYIEDEFDTKAKGYVYNESKEIIAKYDGSLKLN
ncbi:stalk domain-containing protein [Niameybacter massiliensis]|uniref:Stalk domain-containing protein n=1 Tax=Holtiella tumoricola TaxID=3018743 RepID=A0AA42DQ68_9FIRM|nr:stalk domain-containing protein [Holtiella tumoricola]MDA3733225.1 stalk domain-containing protein [Holtiella tumoricola]